MLAGEKSYPCDIRPHETRTSQYTYPRRTDLERDPNILEHLIRTGYGRRPAGIYTRDFCKACTACHAMRVTLDNFTPSASQRKILKNNSDIDVHFIDDCTLSEHMELLYVYVRTRHVDIESKNFIESLLTNDLTPTRTLEARLDGRLIGACLFEEIRDGAFGLSFYYDAENHAPRSLSTFIILKLAEHLKQAGKQYLYMGTWSSVPDNKNSIHYKKNFKPFEIMGRDETWRPFLTP